MTDADISITDGAGNPISNTFEIFSGSIGIGSGTYSGTFRVYNNLAGNSDVPHARNVIVYFSPTSGTLNIEAQDGDPYRNIQTYGTVTNRYSGSCVYSSQSGSAVSGTLQSLNAGISGDDYNIIYSTGTNYNEYDVQFSLPSGVVLDEFSGSLYIAVKYRPYDP